jgi:hypothetical protein
MSNGCPVCAGVGRVLAFGACSEPVPVACPECAGLAVTPASAEDDMRIYSVREITALLLRPALPPGDLQLVESVDEMSQTPVRRTVETETDAFLVEGIVVGHLDGSSFDALDRSAGDDVAEVGG